MTNPFLSSEEYDERAHALYNEGQYDEALQLLREGLALYPQAVELHVGVGYARLAREEYMWARRSFDDALTLDPEHEDALAGLGEVLLKFGQHDAGLQAFEADHRAGLRRRRGSHAPDRACPVPRRVRGAVAAVLRSRGTPGRRLGRSGGLHRLCAAPPRQRCGSHGGAASFAGARRTVCRRARVPRQPAVRCGRCGRRTG
ncbi:MAG: tetratricopeptide repeat protein [Gemmatimonas sp.]|nr:tetratricopeptide repeat protein [Gemmatimonas sp.]